MREPFGALPYTKLMRCSFSWSSVNTTPFAFSKSAANSGRRSEEHTSELQSLMRISYAVFCLKTKKIHYSIELLLIISHLSLYNISILTRYYILLHYHFDEFF